MSTYFTGLAHIGLGTTCFDESIKFYEKLGFEVVSRPDGPTPTVFIKQGDCMFELYAMDKLDGIAPFSQPFSHIAISVEDIEKTYKKAVEDGYDLFTDGIQDAPHWDNGSKYFMITGPCGELVEFNQIL